MKGKALRKHSLHEKTAASVLLKLFIISRHDLVWCFNFPFSWCVVPIRGEGKIGLMSHVSCRKNALLMNQFVLFYLQQYPMYHVSTTWQQVVPRLNVKGRDLLQVWQSCGLYFDVFLFPRCVGFLVGICFSSFVKGL